MTATIELRHEHTDDINAAREKVRSFIDDLGRREGIKGTWDEHRCAIQGTGLSGTARCRSRRPMSRSSSTWRW